MLLIYGKGEGRSVLGDLPEAECAACGKKTAWTAVVDFTYWHVWYLFSFLTGRRYLRCCNACGAAEPFDGTEAKLQFPRDNIPFLKKFGWLVCLAVVGMFLVYGAFSSSARHRQIGALVASPQLYDRYLADLGEVANSGFKKESTPSYGVMILTENRDENGRYVFATSRRAYSRKSDLRKAMNKDDFTYVLADEDPLALSGEELKALHEKKILYEVIRAPLKQP